MYVAKLSLRQVRAYTHKTLEFSPGLNIFYGPNAQGKTTLLEAVYVCALGQSFRTSHLADLIQKETSQFLIEVDYFKCEVAQHLQVYGSTSEKYTIFNGAKRPWNALLGGLTAVASTPDDVLLIKAGPSVRREYIDQQLAQANPLYSHYLKRYTRALKQRNSLLRAQSAETMDVWEQELAQAAAFLMTERKRAVERLNDYSRFIYNTLSGSSSVFSMSYCPGLPFPEEGIAREKLIRDFTHFWKGQRARDFIVGTTLKGPHKDDCLLRLEGKELRHFGSEGEQRTAALALRLGAWELILADHKEDKPVLLIDDIGYGLDAKRQKNLLDWLSKAGQVFVTTTQEPVWATDDHTYLFPI